MDAGATITLEPDGNWVLWLPTTGDEAIRFVAATSTNKSHLEDLLDCLENE